MTAVRITVLKRALHPELAAESAAGVVKQCEVFKDGQEFIAGLTMPEGFCPWAWTDITRTMLALQAGGSFNRGLFSGWMKEGHTAVACCTDGFRPVSFKLERIDTKSLIDVSRLTDPAPVDAYESERWGEFTYAFSGLKAGAGHRVRLHFCEVYHSGAGKRRFSVEAGGKPLLDDFDVFKESGGAYRPIVREFDVSADTKGGIVLAFKKGAADQPKISAIEIRPSSGGKPIFAINAGGQACGAFAADNHYTGGTAAPGS